MFRFTSLPVLFGLLALVACPARAQTPTDTNEGTRLFPDPAHPGALTIAWWGKAGRTYFLQQSDDLSLWTYLPVIEPGADQPIRWNVTSSAPRSFLRLRGCDIPTDDPFAADFDGDGVSNWDELLQGSDPFSAVLAPANGVLPLDWERFYHVPAGTDPDALAPRGDGLTLRQAFNGRLNPNDPYDGAAPVIALVAGEDQRGVPGEFMPWPFVVKVSRTNTDGLPIRGAPVRFSATAGGQLGEAATNGPVAAGAEIIAHTDQDGLAFVFLKPPAGMPDAAFPVRVAPLGGGSSSPAVTVTARTLNDAVPPGAPANLVYLQTSLSGYGEVVLLWTASPNAAAYVVESCNDGQWSELKRTDAREPSLSTWLNDYETSGYRVRPVNAVGSSATVDFPPPTTPFDLPGASAQGRGPGGASAAPTSPTSPPPPTDVRAVNGVLTWTNPPGQELTGYRLEVESSAGGSPPVMFWQTYVDVGADQPTHGTPPNPFCGATLLTANDGGALVVLGGGGGVRYRVSVRNAAGLSAPSEPAPDLTESSRNSYLFEFIDGTATASAPCPGYSGPPTLTGPLDGAFTAPFGVVLASGCPSCQSTYLVPYPTHNFHQYEYRYRLRAKRPFRLRHEWLEWISGDFPPPDGSPWCWCDEQIPGCKPGETLTFANVRSFQGDGQSATSPDIYLLQPAGTHNGSASLVLDLLDLSGSSAGFAGEGNGDAVIWQGQVLSGNGLTPTAWRWKAVGPETHLGPSGRDYGSLTWSIAGEDFNWKPGLYVVSFEVDTKEAGTLHVEQECSVGWRTEEFLVIGQFLNRTHDILPATEQRVLRDALATNTNTVLRTFANVAKWTGNTRKTAEVWAMAYALDPRVWQFPYLYMGPLPDTTQRQELFAVQLLLNGAPDNEGLPAVIADSGEPTPEELRDDPDGARLHYLPTLLEDKEFRLLTRFQAEIMTDDAGNKIRGARLSLADISKGKTKFVLGFAKDEFWPGSPQIGFRDWASGLPPAPEASPYNGRMRVSADGQDFSGRGDGRIGWEGQRPNWGLFGTAAPWIFAETVWHRREDGRGFDPEIKTSVGASYLPNSNSAGGHDPFNQMYVYRRISKGVNIDKYSKLTTLEMLGHLKAFIESGDATLPGLPPQPFVKP